MDNLLRRVQTDQAPYPIGPYSQGVTCGGIVYVSGQIGNDVATGELVAGGIEPQTVQAIANMTAVLATANSSLHRVCSVDVSLARLSDLPTFNKVYQASFSSEVPPARTMREASRLTRDALVELSCVASQLEEIA